MARFLFASTAFRAHLDWGGLLATAVRLARSGHAVVWATDAGRLPAIGQAGLDVVSIPVVDPYRGGMGRDDQLDRTESVALWRAALRGHGAEGLTATPATSRAYAWLVRSVIDAWIQEEALAQSCEALIAAIDRWRPDVVIGEPLMLPARIAASARGVPLAGCGYPGVLLAPEPLPAIAPALTSVCRTLRRLRARAGSAAARDEPELFCWSEPLQIVFFPPDWYGDLRARPSPNVRYVGGGRAPGERRPEPDRRQLDPPLVVVGSSTSYLPAPRVLHAIFEAVRRVGGQVLTAVSFRQACVAVGQPSPDRQPAASAARAS